MPDAPSSEIKLTPYSHDDIRRRIQQAQAQVNLDDNDMKDIVCQYIQDTPVMLDNLVSAWHRNDYSEIVLYAHSLVGVTRLLNFNDVSEYARDIEQMAKKNCRSDMRTIRQLLNYHNASLYILRKMYPCAAAGESF